MPSASPDLVRRAVAVSVDGAPCRPGRIAVRDVGAGTRCARRVRPALSNRAGPAGAEENWADLFGAHYVTIAPIRSPAGGGEHLLGPESPRVAVDFGTPSPVGMAGFVRLGIEHILTGYDHLLFLSRFWSAQPVSGECWALRRYSLWRTA